jgi:hypothetical protein
MFNIPNPCQEDWNQMTPTQRGAFCQKCQIDVIDFTHQSPNQIKETLLKNSGNHLCGHIRQSQINELNQEYQNWKGQSTQAFQSKFLWACLIVFGLTLFTSCEPNEQEEIHEMGKIELAEDTLRYTEEISIEQTKDTLPTKDCSVIPTTNPDEVLNGNIAIDIHPPIEPDCEMELEGDIMMEEDFIDFLNDTIQP